MLNSPSTVSPDIETGGSFPETKYIETHLVINELGIFWEDSKKARKTD